MSGPRRRLPSRARLRPLDPVRSIKAKLGLLVVASTVGTAAIAWYGLVLSDWRVRYTLPVAVLIPLVVTQLLARGMTEPLRQMTAAARAMAEGRPGPEVTATSRDEVGELARAFTAMSRELAAVDEQRRDLLANVGHELRTPVAALQAQLENLADGVRTPDEAALGEVLDQVHRLRDLLSDLLDLARTDAGAVPLARAEVKVRQLAEDVVAQVGAVRPGRRLTVDVVPADFVADADPHRLRQVLTNLVDNAARHAPDGGSVQVRARPDGSGGLVLDVTDDGPGIPPERWDEVFERFERGDVAVPAAAASGAAGDVGGGTGLGLSIARWAVMLHGGQIAVVPAGPGGGCRIRVELPSHRTSTRRPPALLTPRPSVAAMSETTTSAALPAPLPRTMSGVIKGWWTDPGPAPARLLPAALAAGLVPAVLLVNDDRPGLGIFLSALAAAVPVGALAWRTRDAGAKALAAIALALTAVPAVRDADGVAAFCSLVGAALAVAVCIDARRWAHFFIAPPAFVAAVLAALPWSGRTVRLGAARRSGPWLRTVGLSVLAVVVVGALLRGADAAFARVVDAVLPSWRVDLGMLPARAVVLVLATAAVLGAAYAVLARPADPDVVVAERPAGPAVQWLAPLASVGAVIAAFLLVQLTLLFGGHEVVLRGTGVTYAERAREGFGQLTVVTLLVLALLTWAGRRAAPGPAEHRRLFALAGGALAGMTLVLVASALRRMWLYTDAYGWTVLRIFASAFELWIGALLVAVSAAWLLRRTAVLPRLAAGSGAAVLLAVSLAGPDAIVADRAVDRFERTGKIDVDYLSMLSADAVPALQRLPEPQRTCALAGAEPLSDPWYAANLGRARAADSLRARPAQTPLDSCYASSSG